MMAEAVLDLFEPAAKEAAGDGVSDEVLALASIAISLKRVADTLQPSPAHQSVSDTLFYIEQRLGPQS